MEEKTSENDFYLTFWTSLILFLMTLKMNATCQLNVTRLSSALHPCYWVKEVRIWIDISMVAMERILILDQSQSGHFRRGLSRWQSSNWLRASLVGRSTAETCRCHIVLVVTNPITPGSLGRSSPQCSTWMHLRKQRNTWWKGYSLLGLEEELR